MQVSVLTAIMLAGLTTGSLTMKMTFAVTDNGNKRTILRSESMTDKVFERANQIKDELFKLELLKKELKKCIHLSVDISRLEIIRKPFIDAVDDVVTQLKQEYENL